MTYHSSAGVPLFHCFIHGWCIVLKKEQPWRKALTEKETSLITEAIQKFSLPGQTQWKVQLTSMETLFSDPTYREHCIDMAFIMGDLSVVKYNN
mmetsp:Transcript_315/g.681  ORF Transcript_315/g.681 Transcript_315/m.681 type:complete len:94 (-) Transcript_315:27-308(-)